ncbi:MAG: hypothetical protein AAGA44_01945 [Pseudomonadota bacterium]
MIRPLIAVPLSLMLMGIACAEPDDTDENTGEKRRGPPDVAFEACASAVEGDPCSFEGRRGEAVKGSCTPRGEHPLVCVPEGGPPKHRLERG